MDRFLGQQIYEWKVSMQSLQLQDPSGGRIIKLFFFVPDGGANWAGALVPSKFFRVSIIACKSEALLCTVQ
jgi:hypothetical protein